MGDIDEKIPSAEDEKCWNTCFRTVHVNGYPMVVMVTRRDVKKGGELMAYYSGTYGQIVKNMDRAQIAQIQLTGLLDNSILKILDDFDSNQETETYQIV